ncbi:MAG: cbb3-type cytochrome oxidase assembly protein CcoS [Bacteroidota bacterium]|nr:cbb3-type cytochrome oxidase assembly protein CcoS [Bacteroidota bacterium]
MSVIFVLVGFSLFVAIGFLIAFIWSVRDGQYDDDYTPSVRILFEDESPSNSGVHSTKEKSNRKSSDKPKTNK